MVAKQEGKVLMAKVDIDDHTDLAIEYEVGARRVRTFFCWQCKEGPSRGEVCLHGSNVGGEGKPSAYRFLIPQVTR